MIRECFGSFDLSFLDPHEDLNFDVNHALDVSAILSVATTLTSLVGMFSMRCEDPAKVKGMEVRSGFRISLGNIQAIEVMQILELLLSFC